MTEQLLEETGTELAPVTPETEALIPRGPVSQDDWAMLRKVAETVVATEFVPKALRGRKAAVMACLLYGRELGLGPMKSLQEVDMIDGQPSESAALQTAMIRKAGHRVGREEIRDDKGEIVGMRAHGRRKDGTEDSYTFTLEMAQRAGLTGKQNWAKYPEAMLHARSVSQLARFLFSDVFLGSVYTGEELGADSTDDTGRPVDVIEGELVDDDNLPF